MKKILSILLLVGLTSFSAKVTGPRYKVDGAFSAVPLLLPERGSFVKIDVGISTSVSFLPEWKAQINKDFDITFGPKFIANLTTTIKHDKTEVFPNASLGVEASFNYKLRENLKIYTALETGLGVGPNIEITNKDKTVEAKPAIIVKLAGGAKINDRYSIGGYIGYGKGLIGVEVGYTF
ncbi:hypothetical protein [Streptobacillus ratti]|uniref:hypothetical protein n=1 Tax=Streptobacillus ratti TaxID=1720557 RepID=UPI000932F967|nr:hypothetical protein [Streptobacillus ratti]